MSETTMKKVYRNGKPHGVIIEPDNLTREQLLEVLDSATTHIVKLLDGSYDLIDDNNIDSAEFGFYPAEEDVK